jgi:cytidylate kinase
MQPLLITIDGPAGAGKTTVARALAQRLGYIYVDTGALYRAVALAAQAAGIGPDEDAALERLCAGLQLEFVRSDHRTRLYLNGQDVSDRIRSPEITMLASAVSARPGVRRYLLTVQRRMGRQRGAVFEGRDMGTVVFPDADLKFYLDADGHTRALRRYCELQATMPLTLEEVARDMEKRDSNDSRRAIAPLKPADDAWIIDSTDLDVDAVIDRMMTHVRRAAAGS